MHLQKENVTQLQTFAAGATLLAPNAATVNNRAAGISIHGQVDSDPEIRLSLPTIARIAGSANSEAAVLREANERLVVAMMHAQAMREAAEQVAAKMTRMAEHDFLTGLPNRLLLSDRLAQAITLARRHGKKVAMMYVDLDNFKNINDLFGHAVGDQLLQSIAGRMQACVRLSDTVSRQGGDEFVVLLSEIEGSQGAIRIAKELIEAMVEPHTIDGHQIHVTLSIGVSIYPDDGRDVETVARNADTAMYHAKQSGRNNYKIFTPDMNTSGLVRQSIEQGLRQALDQDRFVVYYQPKVNLKKGAITGAEAFLRWWRSDQELVGPEQFLSVAEDEGLILPIGRWILREACRQTRIWLQAGLKLGQIAVNISAREFLDKDFLAHIRSTLIETGMEPQHLEIDLAESGLMCGMQQTAITLGKLNDIGVKIAIDNFGTGYSSLSDLWRLPIDTIKIDRSFVQNSDGNAGQDIASAIIKMGRIFKRRVVAEGIETLEQLAFLQSQRCAEGQGYYFGRPVPAEQFAALLQTNHGR